MKELINKLKKKDLAKIYLALGQVFFLGVGYIAQIILSKLILKPEEFSSYQFANFFTNILNLLISA